MAIGSLCSACSGCFSVGGGVCCFGVGFGFVIIGLQNLSN